MKKIIIIVLSLLLTFTIFLIYLDNKKKSDENKKLILKQQNQVKLIKSHYNKFVITNKETNLYKKEDNKYIVIGLIGSDIEMELKDTNIDENTKYFCNTKDFCVEYESVVPIETLTNINNNLQYEKYIPFNQNVTTNDVTKLYNENGLVYQINLGIDLPLIINDIDKHYVIFNDELLYLNSNEVVLKNQKNSDEKIRNNIRTLTYHFVYNPEMEECNQDICHTTSQFESHLKYVKENNFLALTMNDLDLFLDKKIQIPEKSIVITLDDGSFYENAVRLVDEYQIPATYFIVTSWFDVSNINSQYMDFQSHTDNMHNNYKCIGGNQGGQLLCENEDSIIKDINTSIKKLGDDVIALSYPFFDFNSRLISILNKTNIRLGFIGQYDTDGYSYQNTDKMKLRRKTIFSNTTMNEFISYLN